MLDTAGCLAETNATHVFLVKDGEVRTSTTRACPEGITRQTVLELCAAHGIPAVVRDIPEAEVHEADEVFCTGTMGELAGVVRIDGRTIGPNANGANGEIGPVTTRLSAAYTTFAREHAEAL
jgi:branched-chain amino acid aminotransferase